MKITKTVIDFLKKYTDGNVPDADVHALSDKLGIETSKLESVFYKLAAKYAQSVTESKMNEEASVEAIAISKYTGTRPEAVDKFIATHKLNAKKLLSIAVHGGLSDRMDIVTAMVGNPGNKYQKQLIAQLGESSSRRANDFFSDSKHGEALNNMFKGKFDPKKFDSYLDNLDKNISSDVKYSRLINKLASDAGIDTRQYDNKPLADLEKALKAKTSELYTDYTSDKSTTKPDDFSHLKGQSDKDLSKLLDTIHKQQEINGKQYVTAKKAGQPTKEIEAAGDRLVKREKATIEARAKKMPSKPVSSDAKIKNPETGRNIKVSTALSYDKNSPAYKLAAKKVK